MNSFLFFILYLLFSVSEPPVVIVVGAGIVGCTVAYELAKAGAAVQVLEPRAPGQGATRASAGILAPDIEGHGSMLLRMFGRRSIAMYDDFIARLRADSGHEIVYQRNGTFDLAFSDAEVDRLKELAAAMKQDHIESRWVSPAEFDEFEPLASKQARGALFIPNHGFVGVTSLTLAAAAAAEKNGASFISDTGAIRIFSTPERPRRRAVVIDQVGSRSRRPRRRQLVVDDHDRGCRSCSRQTDSRPVDSAADRSRRHSPGDLGSRRLPGPVAGRLRPGGVNGGRRRLR